MAIDFLYETFEPRTEFSVNEAINQFKPFSDVYLTGWAAIENGAVSPEMTQDDLAFWRRNVREAAVNVGGSPVEVGFFRQVWGGEPKPTDASDITVEYNSAIDFNIYAATTVSGSSGTITGVTYMGVVDGSYTGNYIVFTLAANTYSDNGTLSNINLGDNIYNYLDGQNLMVVAVDKSTPFSHIVTAIPFESNYLPTVYANQAMFCARVQLAGGYSNSANTTPHTKWEVPGYLKTYQPFSAITSWQVPFNLCKSWRDVMNLRQWFDPITNAYVPTFDFKAQSSAREDMLMSEDWMFFAGQKLANVQIQNAEYSTGQYNGFDGLTTSLFYGGGNIQEYDQSYGWDVDFDFLQICYVNDAFKKSKEFLCLGSFLFNQGVQRRSQDMFKQNSGTCTYETFYKSGEGNSDVTRYMVQSFSFNGCTWHNRQVGGFSDSRYLGNGYFPNFAILMPGTGLTDSAGERVPPIEFFYTKGQTLSGQWTEYFVNGMQQTDFATQYSGTITKDTMMAVHGIENMWALMPIYAS